MYNRFLLFGAILGALAVIAGAMLAHQLRQRMPESATEVFETAVRYQFYHVFALLTCGLLSERFPGRWLRKAGNIFILGILFFSGSLYAISALITNKISVPFLLGILTPLGGFCFILGWIFLILAVRSGKSS
jgi:uncharacterized membrane protein YgdD (TMEM256/DUF423 family)